MFERGGQEAGTSPAAPLVARLIPWAVVPVPLLLAAIGVLWIMDVSTSFESRSLLTVLNFTLVTCTSAFIALLAGRTFIARGMPGTVLLGTGVLLMGAAFLVAPLAGANAPGVIATVHNFGMLAAGVLSFAGAWASFRPRAPLRAPGPVMLVMYTGSMAFVAATAYFAVHGLTPPFFVDGVGGTPLRQFILIGGVGAFAGAGVVLLVAQGNATTFRRWYGLGLVLIGIGLLGVTLQEVIGSPVSWVGRLSQYLGSVYLLVASVTSATEARRWGLPLEAELQAERTQAHQLREAKEQLARVLDGSNDGYWEWNIQTGWLDFSERWARVFGYEVSELVPSASTWMGMHHPDDREKARGHQRRIERGEVDRYEADWRFRHKDGQWVWVHVRSKVVERDAEGKPTRMAGTITDISERKAAELALQETKERLSLVIDGSGDGFWDWDVPSGKVKYSRRWASMLGYDLGELEPDVATWKRLVHPDDIGPVMAAVESHLRGESEQYEFEHRVRHKDGRWIWVLDRGRVVARGDDGAPLRMAGTHTDVTERKQAEKALEEARIDAERHAQELQAVLDAVPAAVYITRDPLAQHMETNRFGAELMRVPPDANVSKSAPEDQRPRTFKAMKNGLELSPRHLPVQVAAAQSVEVRNFEFDLVTEDGFTRNLVGNASPLHDESGKPAGAVGAFIDVTAIREAEAHVRESEERLRAIFRSPGVGIVITSQGVGFAEVNDKFCSMLGYSREELQGLTWLGLTHPDDASADAADVRRLAAGEIESFSRDKRYLRKDGSVLWALVSASCVREPSGAIKYGVAVVKDISKRKDAERLLQESESRLAAVIEGTRDGYIDLDLRTGRSHRSSRYWEIIGWPPGSYSDSPMDFLSLIHPDDSARVTESFRAITSGRTEASDEEFRIRSSTGTWTWVNTRVRAVARDADGKPRQISGTITDVTDRRALQEQVTVAQRLAALGTLVAGLAHEINNPLAAEMSGQGLALEVARESRKRVLEGLQIDPDRRLRELGEVIEALEDAQDAGQRVAKIVRDMASFARPDSSRTRVRLREVLDDGMRWVPQPLRATADIEVEDRGAPDVLASPGQLAQVALNLLTNALKATPPGSRGRVVIRLGAGKDGQATLEVADKGVGIAPEHRGRVFEPFFTTRPTGEGRGTGLGLAVCHSIVSAHGGIITVESEAGKGSTFRVELPAAPAEA